MTITSPTNQHLSEVRKLARASARARSGRFAVEGEDLQAAAAAAGRDPVYVLAAAGEAPAGALQVAPELLAAVSTLGSGTRLIGVYEQRWEAPRGPLAVALWGVRDPGNLGTIIRAAHAFGAACVALGPGCADPHGPKAARATMGAIFSTPIARFDDLGELPAPVIGLEAGAARALRGPLAGEATLLVGGERGGLPPAVRARCDELRSIPQAAGDSLNVAMAATVALYEATRPATRMADG